MRGGVFNKGGMNTFCFHGNMKKRGQEVMGLPFGMIFAIFLIIVFIMVAFIAIKSFLDIGRSSSVGMFYDELQGTVNDAISGQSSEANFNIDLPPNIKQVCFANLSAIITNSGSEYDAIKNYDVYNANVFLVPPEYAQGMQWKLIKYLNITKITTNKNPYCVNIDDGLKIKKGFYDKLVWVE